MPSEYDDRDDDELEDDRDDDRPRSRRDVIEIAKSRVKGPAIGLLIMGIISLLLSLGGIVNILSLDRQFADLETQWDNDPNMTPQQRKDSKEMLGTIKPIAKMVLPISVAFGIVTGFLTIFGSIKMMKLSGSGMAKLGSILSMIPCASGCCVLGVPFGIWALIALGKPEVKAGFAAVARSASGMESED